MDRLTPLGRRAASGGAVLPWRLVSIKEFTRLTLEKITTVGRCPTVVRPFHRSFHRLSSQNDKDAKSLRAAAGAGKPW